MFKVKSCYICESIRFNTKKDTILNRPVNQGTAKRNGLLKKANVKITDVSGNLVYEATFEGGMPEWDTTAFGKYKAASGVDMIFISAQDGSENKVKKVMIIR